MNKEQLLVSEQNKLKKFKLLPYSFKRFGIGLLIVSFITLLLLKFLSGDFETTRLILKKILTVSLFLIAMSQDKSEDELTIQLRNQAFALAFTWGVILSFTQPYANLISDYTLGKDNPSILVSNNQLINTMLLVQIGFYFMFKRAR